MPAHLSVFDRIKESHRLPTLPKVALGILDVARTDETSLPQIVKVLGSDPALATRILRYANSAILGSPRAVSSLEQAVTMIGLTGVRMLALSFSLITAERKNACQSFNYDAFWSRSLACGVAARSLARHVPGLRREDAFLAGLVCHIGQLALACGVPEEYDRVLKDVDATGASLSERERAAFGGTHLDVTQQLLEEWQFPPQLVEAIIPLQGHVGRRSDAPGLTRVLPLANDVADVIVAGTPDFDRVNRLLRGAQDLLDICPEAWEESFAAIVQDWQHCGNLCDMRTAEVRSFSEIEAEAREQLARLSLSLQIQHRELHRLATTDALTGVANRGAFRERLELELERARRTKQPLTLILVDADHFKAVNDQYGHLAGDHVLQQLAVILQAQVRKVDLVARCGGEEFAVIAPECHYEGATVLTGRLREAVEKGIFEFSGERLAITVSLGAAVVQRPVANMSLDALYMCADHELYAAKRAGRNCFRVAALENLPPAPDAVRL